MKSKQRLTGAHRLHAQLPFVAHLVEVFSLLIVFTIGQNLFAEVVGANPDITPPTVPNSLSITGRSATSIDLSWAASTDDVAVTGYHVYRDGTVVGTPTGTTYSDSGLTPNTGYSYTVSAFDAATNESAQSAAAPPPSSTLTDTTPPSVPNGIHQTGSTTSTVTIAWNPSTDNVSVTGYDIYRNGSLQRSQSGTSYTDTGLAVFTNYVYTITSHDAAGNTSNLSAAFNGSTARDITPPSVPDGITKTGSTITSVSLSWNASTDDVGVIGYRLYRDNGGTAVASTGATSYTDTGLAVGSSHLYTITAYDNSGNESAHSAVFSTSSSNDTTPPSTPANLTAPPATVLDTSIKINWDASTDDVAVTGYKVYRGGMLIGTATTATLTDSNLNPDTAYSYTVVAYDAANNNSASSLALSVTTAHDTTPPAAPTNLRSTARTDSSISLAWDAAIDNNAVAGYDLYRGTTLINTTSGLSYVDNTGLSVNTSYTYRLVARDASGNNSVQSAPYTVSTLTDTILPSTPAGLASPAKTTTTVDLTWGSSTDDVAVAGYKVYRNGIVVANQSGTSFTDTGLRYNTNYSYTVSSVDTSGNESPLSAPLSVPTLPDTVAPTVTLTAPQAGTVQLTFPISATASDNLDLNRVEFYADSLKIATISAAPFSFNWNSYAVHNGAHVITARAYDATGNSATSSVTVNLTNPPPIISGDINGDHKVNIFDLSILLSHWNKSGAGDLNGNGRVDIFDLSVLLSQYGKDNSNYN